MSKRRILWTESQTSPTFIRKIDAEEQNRTPTIRVGRKIFSLIGLAAVMVTKTPAMGKRTSSFQDTSQANDWLPTTRRFPRYGTPEFAQQCNWTIYQPTANRSKICTLLLQPPVKHHEGLADWISRAASGFIAARLKGGCQLLIDYGPSVDIHQVLVPHDDVKANNWTIPTGFTECTKTQKCSKVQFKLAHRRALVEEERKETQESPIPEYRHAFFNSPLENIYRTTFRYLETALPGFELETGMACALTSLFHLSPRASQFEPNLVTDILPKLRDERNLVFTVYLRTDHADHVATAERNGDVAIVENASVIQEKTAEYLPCVVKLEQEYLSNSSPQPSISRILWMVVSDSPLAKEWIIKEYTSPNVNAVQDKQDGRRLRKSDKKKASTSATNIIPREIVTTTTRGLHTRTARRPSTVDFAEGVIDWYLIGESDVVFTNGLFYSYGTTGALRTNRPVYNFDYRSGTCNKTSLIHEEEPPDVEVQHFVQWEQ